MKTGDGRSISPIGRFYRIARRVFGFQKRRMRAFETRFCLESATRVVDLGGHPLTWTLVSRRPAITILNLHRLAPVDLSYGLVIGDCRKPIFREDEFDIAFSNSVIEHLGGADEQRAFADQVRRIARFYYIQTPYKFSVFEPHLLVFLIHLLPRPLYKWLACLLSPWRWMTGATRDRVSREIDSIRPLSEDGLRDLFPDAVIERERVFGFTKSLIAIKAPGRHGCPPRGGGIDAKRADDIGWPDLGASIPAPLLHNGRHEFEGYYSR